MNNIIDGFVRVHVALTNQKKCIVVHTFLTPLLPAHKNTEPAYAVSEREIISMKKYLLIALLVCGFAFIGCDDSDEDEDSGMCYSAGTDEYYTGECFDDWLRATCEDFDARGVNNTTWTFVAGGSCSNL